jgi:Domain of unknown function (DUF4831)
MKKLTLIPIYAIIMMSACRTSFRVQDSNEPTPTNAKELVTYYLPKTLLKIKIPIERNSIEPGLVDSLKGNELNLIYKLLYENYGWKKVELTEKFSLGEKIQFVPITVADPKKQFTISYKKSKSIEQSLGLTLGKEGIISSGEFAQSDKTYEYVTKGVEMLASTVAKFYSLGGGSNIKSNMPINSNIYYKRIEKLLNELEDLAATKILLIKNPTGGVSSSEPIKFRLELIDNRIKMIKEEIMGKIKTTVINLSLIYEPGTKTELTLIKIDPTNGYEIPEGISPSSLPEGSIKIKPGSTIKELKILPTLIQAIPKPKKEFTTSTSYTEHFLVYNVPAKYSIELLLNDKKLKSYTSASDEKGTEEYEIWFPQKGHMEALPYGFKELKVTFFEDIGAIKELKYMKGANLDARSISSGITALDSLVSLRSKYKESKKEEPVEEKEETKEQVIRLIIDKVPVP